ncbi:MAG: transposase [Candidatus Aenigmarchaeota archaeon]|nr:transposase [Candidatus Aenigmarchaeota archaeon]
MRITYKFRLYPSKEQEQKLLEVLEKCRFVYNKLLEKLEQDKPSRLELQNSIPKLKEEHQELKEVYSKVLQYESYRLFSNLRALARLKKNGRKVGRLRFKGKSWFKTIHFNQSGFKLIKTGKRCERLHLSKIGDIKIRIHRKIKGKIKQVIIKRYSSGKWYACIQVENNVQAENAKNKLIEKKVGIDVGIKHFLTDSDGLQIENPKYLDKSYKRLRIEHRKLSRKEKESKNREKQRIRLSIVYERVVNQRLDFLHKLSRYYVDNYDFIAVEELDIKNMVRSYLAKWISDVSWNRFIQFLSYKAENAGKIVVKVNPRGTSKEYKFGKLDKDYNASLNILVRGLDKVGMGQAEFTPLETEPLPVRASSVVELGSSFR